MCDVMYKYLSREHLCWQILMFELSRGAVITEAKFKTNLPQHIPPRNKEAETEFR
jgi:hypothetical protein